MRRVDRRRVRINPEKIRQPARNAEDTLNIRGNARIRAAVARCAIMRCQKITHIRRQAVAKIQGTGEGRHDAPGGNAADENSIVTRAIDIGAFRILSQEAHSCAHVVHGFDDRNICVIFRDRRAFKKPIID